MYKLDKNKIDELIKISFDEGYEVYLSILLTKQCNFECDHCFYDCKQTDSCNGKSYIKEDVLSKVLEARRKLKKFFGKDQEECKIYLNLIGGEPTLNMAKFKWVIDYIDKKDGFSPENKILISTNGWWLEKLSNTKRFFDILENALYNEGVNVRISQDKYHARFRKSQDIGYPKKLLDERLEQLFSDPYCLYSKLFELYSNNDQFVYVENSKCKVMPNGRAFLNLPFESFIEMDCKNKCYDVGESLTFSPTGNLIDICCHGSSFNKFATIDDDPVALLIFTMLIGEKINKDCFKCFDKINCLLEEFDARNTIDGIKKHLEENYY
jgi:hypothetical protein